MTTLKFTTVDQHLVLKRQPVVASGDKNSVLIQIDLCSMWDGFDVKVAFYKDGNRDFVLDIPLENGECMVPPEMLDSPCVLNIGVWGKDARGRYKTSTMVKYRVSEGTPIEAGVVLIDVSDGTAEEDQVLAGATFFAGDTAKKTGNVATFDEGEPEYVLKGDPGESTYEIACRNGFYGTEKEWLDSLTKETADKAETMIANTKTKALTEIGAAEAGAVAHIENMADSALNIVQGKGSSETAVMSQKAATEMGNQLSEAIDKQSEEIDKHFEKEFLTQITKDSPFLTCITDQYPNTANAPTPLVNYRWYEFIAPCDFYIYADETFTDVDDIIFVIYNGAATSENAVQRCRYRTDPSENNIPTENNKVFVKKGQLVTITIHQTKNANWFSFNADGLSFESVLSESVKLGKSHIDEAKKNVRVAVGTNQYTINLNGFDVLLEKTVNADTRANLWNIVSVKKNGTYIVPPMTDIIGVLKEEGQTDFMGGVHGDENNIHFLILADGKEIVEDVVCKRVDVVMLSKLTRVSTGEHIIDRYVHLIFEDESIEVNTSFKCLVDNFKLNIAYNGGMLAWFDNNADFATTNIGVIESNSDTVAKTIYLSHDLYRALAKVGDNMLIVENVIGHSKEAFEGEAFYYGNEQPNPRLKMYFATEKNTSWNAGYVCNGSARYTFV